MRRSRTDPAFGYPSLTVMILLLGGMQLMALRGLLGEYLGRIFNETKCIS